MGFAFNIRQWQQARDIVDRDAEGSVDTNVEPFSPLHYRKDDLIRFTPGVSASPHHCESSVKFANIPYLQLGI